VIAERDTGYVRTDGLADREWVQVATRSKPKQVVLDPRVRSHDWNMLNNRKRLGWLSPRSLLPPPGTDWYFHRYFSTRSRRDRLTVGVQPTLWYNDAGGVTLGVRSRDDYLGRFEQNQALVTASTGWGADDEVRDIDFFLRARNPVFLRAPNMTQTFDAFNVEGRYGAAARIDWTRKAHLSFGPTWSSSVGLEWVATDDFRYLDRGQYDPVSTIEVQLASGVQNRLGSWAVGLKGSAGGGLAYKPPGQVVPGRPDLDALYFRGFVEGIARRPLGRLKLGLRGYLGVASGKHAAAKQRQIYFQGSDPLSQLYNPFLRSRGALLAGKDFNYHSPGGAGVRGVDARISSASIAALNVEIERALVTRPDAHLFNRIALAAFTDWAYGLGSTRQPVTGDRIHFLGDGGIGLRAEHRIGDTQFVTRLDLPLFFSRPALAQDRESGDNCVAFRWVFSFDPAF
jgi:hypothetical protein